MINIFRICGSPTRFLPFGDKKNNPEDSSMFARGVKGNFNEPGAEPKERKPYILSPSPKKPNCVSSINPEKGHFVAPLQYFGSIEATKAKLLKVIDFLKKHNQMNKNIDYTKDKTLCALQKEGYIYTNVNEYKKLIQSAKFCCRNCGRSALNAVNLCNSDKL
jgi:hypothetical protein